MDIYLEKFGTILVSRPMGKEAFLALQPLLKDLGEKEEVKVDFSGVSVFTPSWADEFITPLVEKYKERLVLVNTQNPSVKASLETLRKAKLARENNQ